MKNIIVTILFTFKISYFIFSLIFIISCREERANNLQIALLLAEENGKELQKVLDYYKNKSQDSLKYKAACFLIENMPYYHYYEGAQLDNYEEYYRALALRHDLPPSYILDSITNKYGKFSLHNLELKYDIKEIDSAYLCNNIEWSFKVWEELPWGKNISFDDFCEFILPYRLANEKPVYWKEEIYTQFMPLIKNLSVDDPLEAVHILTDSLKKIPYRFTTLAPEGFPRLGPFISKYLSGTCQNITDYNLYVCRALGIPCHLDFFPLRGDENAGHSWISYTDKEGNLYIQDFLEHIMPVRSSHIREFNKLKVYRHTFSQNHTVKNEMMQLEQNIHPFFNDLNFTDVTVYYADCFAQILDIPKEKLYPIKSNSSIVYLCLADKQDWIPVTWGKREKGVLRFYDISKGSVMRGAIWEDNQLIFITPPFLFKAPEGELHFFSPSEDDHNVILFSKTNLKSDELFLKRMVGGVFEGSNSPTFNEKDTLFFITQKPHRLLNRVYPTCTKNYRYIRYFGPKEGYCNISEVAFYTNLNDTLPLKGNIIGTPGSWGDDKNHDYINVFDGKTDTSFDYKNESGGWVGLDLEKPMKIAKIIYTPRNRDNFIRPNDKYELFICEDYGWKTLGIKIAKSDSLLYENVPINSLLYLKNHTRGTEERIFTYKDGEVKWW